MTIFGFKSFADKITVKFTPGMTCIVGPNGCGKSNISDALRWVFGEQSAKKLRGGMMQDIIFNGTTERKPLQMSEVNVVIDNESKLLPIEYNEVEVTRRVFRDGDSEYYINKKRCRLKDVQDLITDTGIGMSAYSFIEQGMISQILSTKPEERRAIFEEAAGIMKYRTRKKETMSKLVSTDENLNRLKDIIYEIERQMKHLERQVEKAAVYKEKFTALKDRELLYHRKRNVTMLEERARVDKNLKDHKMNASQLLVSINKITAELETLQLQLTEKEQEYRTRESEIYAKKFEMNKSESQIQGLEKDRQYFENDIRSLTEQNEELMIMVENMQVEAAMWQKDLQKMSAKITEQDTLLIERVTTADAAKNAIITEEQNYQKKINSLLELMKDESNARSAVQKSVNDLEHYRKNCDTLRAQNNASLTAKQQAESELDTLRNERDTVSGTKKTVADDLQTITEKKNKQTELIAVEERNLQTAKDELTRLQARFDGLDMLDKRMEGLKSGVKHVLEKKSEFSLKGILAEYMDVEKGFDRIVDFVLGDAVEIIIGDTANHTAIRDFVRSRKNGEHVVYYSGTAHNKKIVHKQSLLHHCKLHNESIRPLLESLLGHVVYADAADIALLTQGFTVVTPDGSMHCPDGTIVFADLENQGMGIIERKTVKEDVSVEIGKAQSRINEIEKTLTAHKNQLQDLIARFDSLTAEITKADEALAENAKKIEFLEKDRERFLLSIAANEKQITIFEKDIAFIADSLTGHETAVKDIKLRSEQEENEKLTFQKNIHAMREQLDKELADQSVVKADISRAKAEMQSKQNDIKRVQGVIQDNTLKVASNEKTIASHKDKIAQTFTNQELSRNAITTLLYDIAEAEKINVACGELINGMKKNISDKTSESRKLDETFRNLQGILRDSEIAFTHCEDAINSAREYIRTKYDIVIDDYAVVIPEDYKEHEEKKVIDTLLNDIRLLGSVNLSALEEYTELKERYDFLAEQKKDLDDAKNQLTEAIDHIDEISKEQFIDTFYKIKENFLIICPMLFNGGKAEMNLVLEEDEDVLNAGIDVNVKPPGKRLQNINLLSGGEKALSAIALLFSIFKVKPAPFCVLDEIDAPLDDANIGRFVDMLADFTDTTQFIIVTHSKATMEKADVLYGVTMPEAGISKLVSVQFKGVAK